MTAHAQLFSRVSSRALCEWTLEGENEAFLSHQWTEMSFTI